MREPSKLPRLKCSSCSCGCERTPVNLLRACLLAAKGQAEHHARRTAVQSSIFISEVHGAGGLLCLGLQKIQKPLAPHMRSFLVMFSVYSLIRFAVLVCKRRRVCSAWDEVFASRRFTSSYFDGLEPPMLDLVGPQEGRLSTA